MSDYREDTPNKHQKKNSEEGNDERKDKKPSDITNQLVFNAKITTRRITPENELCPQALASKGFTIGKELNRGQFGVIYEAKCASMPDKRLVCKRCSLKDVNAVWVEKCLKIEMKVLKKLKHENIVKCYELFKTRTAAFIFMDYIENGNISEYMSRHKRALSERQTKLWFGDIIDALVYCHGYYIAHRDLKLENFMISREDKAILTDFGFACLSIDPTQVMVKGTQTGTADYMAPEIRGLKAGKVYDPMVSDMYSMGVCLYEMLHYSLPFGQNTSQSTYKRQISRQYTPIAKHLSAAAKDLITKLLDPEVKNRITAKNALYHDFLKVKKLK